MTTTKEEIKTEEKAPEGPAPTESAKAAPKAPEESAPTETPEKTPEKAPESAKAEQKTPGDALPELNFTSFILSLSSSALMSLGVVDNPVTGKRELAPAIAKQTIDLIALLKEKTAGNLDEGESKLVDDVLGELRLWYCKVVG